MFFHVVRAAKGPLNFRTDGAGVDSKHAGGYLVYGPLYAVMLATHFEEALQPLGLLISIPLQKRDAHPDTDPTFQLRQTPAPGHRPHSSVPSPRDCLHDLGEPAWPEPGRPV